MKDLARETISGQWTERKMFDQLREILDEVASYKITGDVTLDTSLVKDYAFDSIDIMEVLLKVQQRFLDGRSIDDIDKFINRAFRGEDGKPVTVRAMCGLILEIIDGI
jgi:acyl carrier protein